MIYNTLLLSLEKLNYFKKETNSSIKIGHIKELQNESSDKKIKLELDFGIDKSTYIDETINNTGDDIDPKQLHKSIQSALDKHFQSFKDQSLDNDSLKKQIESLNSISDTNLALPLKYFNDYRKDQYGKDTENVSLVF